MRATYFTNDNNNKYNLKVWTVSGTKSQVVTVKRYKYAKYVNGV
jgi:hypothetical protein